MNSTKTKNEEYILGHSNPEMERLEDQGKFLYHITRNLLANAGISKGMKVLDFGAGSGDVSIIVSELVGETGEVIAIERSADAVERARKRIEYKGIKNVKFINGDENIELSKMFIGKFDAVVGRLVLVHQKNPIETLCNLTKHLVPGGIVAFHEVDIEGGFWSNNQMPLMENTINLIFDTVIKAGLDKNVKGSLINAFDKVGIVQKHIIREGIIESGESHVYDWVVEFLRSLFPVIEKMGIAKTEDINIDTLAKRLTEESIKNKSIFIPVSFIQAYGRIPQLSMN